MNKIVSSPECTATWGGGNVVSGFGSSAPSSAENTELPHQELIRENIVFEHSAMKELSKSRRFQLYQCRFPGT